MQHSRRYDAALSSQQCGFLAAAASLSFAAKSKPSFAVAASLSFAAKSKPNFVVAANPSRLKHYQK
jgi:hypothetical protein